ncbi:uncharacterized protein C8Q71DRAFT_727273 [Rhodofomes roseus]|uniref:Uncharacterized protein n=1 Tax=Rhodofomes roseus TaxID=34475 RepID=A0ABQ8K3F1_9APHY|nr:uncharacterized protein C8Q71DRAFT_727273 [Rhodofomes roseus]KAH9830806.1 hypothetical protein C8Q71DRAFT_727273 [Rhodofomes roseus]
MSPFTESPSSLPSPQRHPAVSQCPGCAVRHPDCHTLSPFDGRPENHLSVAYLILMFLRRRQVRVERTNAEVAAWTSNIQPVDSQLLDANAVRTPSRSLRLTGRCSLPMAIYGGRLDYRYGFQPTIAPSDRLSDDPKHACSCPPTAAVRCSTRVNTSGRVLGNSPFKADLTKPIKTISTHPNRNGLSTPQELDTSGGTAKSRHAKEAVDPQDVDISFTHLALDRRVPVVTRCVTVAGGRELEELRSHSPLRRLISRTSAAKVQPPSCNADAPMAVTAVEDVKPTAHCRRKAAVGPRLACECVATRVHTSAMAMSRNIAPALALRQKDHPTLGTTAGNDWTKSAV